MAYTSPSTQRVSSSLHASASGTYPADFNRFKEDLAGVLKSKLGIDMGGSRLYQKSYPPEFDFVSYPVGWRIPEFVKFNACWHFLAQSLGMVSSQQRRQKTLGQSPIAVTPWGGARYVLTFTEGSASARIYHCSISPKSIQGIIIYISQGMACGKTSLNYTSSSALNIYCTSTGIIIGLSGNMPMKPLDIGS